MLFALNAMDGIAGRNLGIITAALTLIPAIGGLGWLIYLTYGAIVKCNK
jgi:hypothetical protein